MHYNLFHLAERGVWPDLAVIDGFESMEGRGPAWGTPLATRLALASRDPLAADVVGTTIMGFDPGRILYLKAMTEAGIGPGRSGQDPHGRRPARGVPVQVQGRREDGRDLSIDPGGRRHRAGSKERP